MRRLLSLLLLATLMGVAGFAANSHEVVVHYDGTTATVDVAEDITQFITVKIKDADITVTQSADVVDEITYRLSGETDNGSFIHSGDFKITLSLEGLRLASQTGVAMQIKNGKRIAVVLKDGTENVLTDADGGSQKACMVVKGHAEFQGGGSLTINGRGKHAYKGDEYVELKAGLGTLTLNSTVKDGIHIDQYFLMKGGTLNITTTGGGYWDKDDLKTKAPAGINSATDVIIRGGTLNLLSTGDGAKCIKCDSTFTMEGGSLTAHTKGARYIYELYEGDKNDVDNIPDSLKTSPKAVKADFGICITGGSMNLYTEQDGGEGLESKDTLTITGGNIHIEAFDDCINAAGDIRITSGDLYLYSIDNDGIDTNQSMYITGGNIVTLGNYMHELGIDVNDKSPYKNLYIQGGTIVCVGGTSQIARPFASDEAQPVIYCKGKFNASMQLLLSDITTGEEVMRYILERDYTQEAGGTAPDLIAIFTSPLLKVGEAYELRDESTGQTLGIVTSLESPYSDMTTEEGLNIYEALFEKAVYTYGDQTLPYRWRLFNGESMQKPAILLYLHEAPSRGTDNTMQLQEVAIDSICRYLSARDIPVMMIVPHCPPTTGWTGRLRRVVNELVKQNISNNGCDASRIYVVGCSIGATGTWCQLSNYPDFYAAAMPIAGDPTGYNAANVATTPVRTVMGSADTVMPLANVQSFLPDVTTAGGTLLLDILDGADHVTTCNTAFTTDRLDWLFAQKRSSETGIIGVMSITSNNDAVYDLNGRRVSPPKKGIYMQNGKKVIF